MKLIPLTKGKFAQVDDEDYEVLSRWKWQYTVGGYAVHSTTAQGRPVKMFMHRFLMSPEKGMVVDHIDQNKLNNQRSNLRIVSQSVNIQNRLYKPAVNLIGVSYVRDCDKFKAEIQKHGERHFLGEFKNPFDAAKAYDAKAYELFGSDALTNEKIIKKTLTSKNEQL